MKKLLLLVLINASTFVQKKRQVIPQVEQK